ncbi:hypothetical protein ACJIZ3_012118 [Penstemon smallii]|uniref:Uncharacterized protein n=1 Tax=Penstemon smallii TaxID=265156 RepID=A0ABD3UL29_9LAMI
MSTQFDPSAKFIKSPTPASSPRPLQPPVPGRPHQSPNPFYGNGNGNQLPPPNSDSSQLPLYQPPVMAPPRHYYFAPYMYPQMPFPMIPYAAAAAQNVVPINHRSWSTSLLDCFSDTKNTVITCICPCFTFGQITEIMNEGKTSWLEYASCFALPPLLSGPQFEVIKALLGFKHPEYIMIALIGFLLLPFLGIWRYRMKLRNKYKLKGNGYMDFILSFLCCHLVLCQQYRQLDRIGYDVSLGWHANREKHKIIMNSLVQPAVPQGMFR